MVTCCGKCTGYLTPDNVEYQEHREATCSKCSTINQWHEPQGTDPQSDPGGASADILECPASCEYHIQISVTPQPCED